MKIIMILTNSFDPDVRVYKEAKYLVAKGLDVEIVCWDRKGKESNYPENEMVDGIIITRFREHSIPGTGLKQLPAFFRFAKRVKKYLKIQDYDYLHCHDLDGRIVGKKSNVKKKPIIFDMHEFYEKGNSIVKFVFRKMVMRLIDKSKYALYENDVYIRPPYCKYNNKLFSLKNYPDKDMVQALPKTKSGVFRICYHGAIRNQIPYFQALFIAASRLGERVRVDINGGGIDYDELKQMAEAYENVHVNGKYNGAKETNLLYSNTDVLFCGYDKNVPNHQHDAEAVKFFEAIITGTPMIMQKDIGMGDKVEKKGYGISIDTDNSDEIEKAILRFMTDRLFYEKCRKNELHDAPNYSWDNEVKVLEKIYINQGEQR